MSRRRRSHSDSASSDDDHDNDHRKRRREKRRRGEEEEEDVIIDFEPFRSKLAKIFFRDEDVIKYGSEEYKDFWRFLRKYQGMERQRMERGERRRKSSRVQQQCFRLLPADPRDLLNRIPFQDSDDRDGYLSRRAVVEFRRILALYVDFLQREKFTKLRKLREAQAGLPIAEYRGEILRKVAENQVVVVAGDTGCGKSTQVPQYLLQAGYQGIACTQPRRIACIALAKRVGYETLNEYGSEIGYQIRFERKKTDRTRVLFLTEGLLLRQVATDPSLSAYGVIVLDEVHERHLHGDFLLGVVKCLVQQRSDLKVILMSATINIKLFQDYFHGEAPVVQVPGRLYPINLKYLPVPSIERSSNSEKLNPAPYVRILQLIDKKYPEKERGDVLIFLSGLKEITTVSDACKEYAETTKGRWIVLPLHSTLSLAEQDRVFDYAPDGVRKCVVSTNIAETSVTIDGIRFVVDSGKVKEMQHDAVCKMQRLKEFWVSRASAEQRKGRAGRTGPGVCFRLYEESEYRALTPYATPEIQRVPLDTLVLQMLSMGLPDARKFPFIEPPAAESLENSILALKEQGALNEDETLTVTGRALANLPVDVSVGKMLIMGTLFHQVESVLSLAAALSVQSPFTNSAYRDSDCVAARRNLDSDHGDPITLLNAYREWLQVKAERSENSRKWCRKRGLEEQRFYEMTKLREQFKDLLEQAGLMKKEESDAMARMSSSERASRHGELRQLREMKKEQLQKEGPRRKKFLKVSEAGFANTAGEDDEEVDLKDIEFRLRHDGRKVKHLLEGARAYTYRDLTVLKLIVAAGLYPQLALADEFNASKSGSDQLFHTRVKPFNVLHPNCIFAANPEYITLESSDLIQVPGFPSKHPVSSKHQLLVYLSLLETNKPYVMNAMRMPALQTLLLFSHAVDTNAGLSRLVFDSWLEVRFPDPERGQNLLLRASVLRRHWQRLLSSRLLDCLEEGESDRPGLGSGPPRRDPVAAAEEQALLERRLSRGLLEFIHSETPFSLRRLLPGDVKVLYVGPGENCALPPPDGAGVFDPDFDPRPNDKKGGFLLAEYLTYDCLEERADEVSSAGGHMCSDWVCPLCEESVYCAAPLLRLLHYAGCAKREEEEKARSERREEEERTANPNARSYHCRECGKTFSFTSTEILKHKRSHRS